MQSLEIFWNYRAGPDRSPVRAAPSTSDSSEFAMLFNVAPFRSLYSGPSYGNELNACTLKNSSYFVW